MHSGWFAGWVVEWLQISPGVVVGMIGKTYLLDDHCRLLTMQRQMTEVIVEFSWSRNVQYWSLHLWSLKLKVKYQQRYLVGVLAVIDAKNKESVVASQPLTSYTQQFIEISNSLFDHLWHFLTLSLLQSLISSFHTPFTTLDRLSAWKIKSFYFYIHVKWNMK